MTVIMVVVILEVVMMMIYLDALKGREEKVVMSMMILSTIALIINQDFFC